MKTVPCTAVGVFFISLIASAASAPGTGWQARVSHDLLRVYTAATSAPTVTASQPKASPARSSTFARFDAHGRVQVDVHVSCAVPSPTAALTAAGLRTGSAAHVPPYCVVEGWIPPANVPALASVVGVTQVKLPAYAWHKRPRVPPGQTGAVAPPLTMSGRGVAQGAGGPAIDGSAITIMRADQYISQTTVTGAGVTVGVMSGDVTNLAVIQGRGELPPSIQVVTPSGSTNPRPTDEGTMMLEEVHAVAPGATLAFCGPQTSVDYVMCLDNLVGSGATILVDDLAYPGEDLMSAASTFAQGVQNFLAQNPSVALFTVTENYNGSYWEGAYAPISLASLGFAPQTCTANGQVDNYVESFGGQYWQALTVDASGSYPIGFQWADPFDQNGSNFDVYIQDTTGTVSCAPAAGSTATQMWGEPSLSAGTYYIWVATPDASLSGKFLKLFVGGDGATALSLATSGSTISPQAFIPAVLAVGAVSGADDIGDTIEPYSGLGPINLIFPTPTAVQAPTVVAPDAIYVDAAGTLFPLSPAGTFLGTSAAAPNAAAVAALLRSAFPSLNPTQLRAALESGAAYLGTGGNPNGIYGYGRVDALGALGTLPTPTMSRFPNVVVVGGSSSPGAPFTISGFGNLHLSVMSSNPALVPGTLVPAGTPGITVSPATCGAPTTSCTIAFTPAIGLTGTAQITLTDTDGAHRSSSITSSVTVTQPPPPTIAVGSGGSQSVAAGAGAAPVSFTVAGTGALSVSANISNPALVSGVAISSGCGTKMMACTANLSLMPSHSGTATVTFQAKDAWSGVGRATATMNVAAPASGGGGGSIDALTLLMFAGVAGAMSARAFCRHRLPAESCPRRATG